HIDTEQPAETVEVVHIAAAHAGGQRLKRFVDRHAELARLLAVKVDFDLGVARGERSKKISQLRPLSRCFHKLTCVVAELLHAERAAAVLQKKVKTGRSAKAGDRRNIERKDDRL